MLPVGQTIDVVEPPEIVPVEVDRGRCAVALTGSPYELTLPWGVGCYAVLASWLDENAPVGMFVTFHDGRLGEGVRDVQSVYAHPKFRGLEGDGTTTAPVAVGQWLFQTGRLTRHSEDRTDAGDRWARRVGGEPPPQRLKEGSPDDVHTFTSVLGLLNTYDWRSFDIWGSPRGPVT